MAKLKSRNKCSGHARTGAAFGSNSDEDLHMTPSTILSRFEPDAPCQWGYPVAGKLSAARPAVNNLGCWPVASSGLFVSRIACSISDKQIAILHTTSRQVRPGWNMIFMSCVEGSSRRSNIACAWSSVARPVINPSAGSLPAASSSTASRKLSAV